MEAPSLGALLVGTPVLILENTFIEQKIDGFLAYWYKIEVGSDTGYVWGGYIAASYKIADFKNYLNEDKGYEKTSLLYIYYRHSSKDSFDLRTDFYIYTNENYTKKKLDLPYPGPDPWGDILFHVDDFEIYYFNNDVFLYFYRFEPINYAVAVYSISSYGEVRFIGWGVREHK